MILRFFGSLKCHHFDPVFLIFAVARSVEADWTGPGSLDTYFLIDGKLAKYYTCPRVMQPYCVSDQLIAMFP